MNIQVIQWQEALSIRHKVLWPSKPAIFCKVDGDEDAKHYGAYINRELVCVASIYIKGNTARLRKFATLNELQGRGIGSTLIAHIINELKENDILTLWCDARTTAINFYRKLGMVQQGGEFDKSGVCYVKMKIEFS